MDIEALVRHLRAFSLVDLNREAADCIEKQHNELILQKAISDSRGSMMLSLQKDCIAMTNRYIELVTISNEVMDEISNLINSWSDPYEPVEDYDAEISAAVKRLGVAREKMQLLIEGQE